MRRTLFERMGAIARGDRNPRTRHFPERVGEVDQLRRPEAIRKPLELPARDLDVD